MIFAAFIKQAHTHLERGTLKAYAQALDAFLDWMGPQNHRSLDDVLTRQLLQDFYAHLGQTGRHGRARKGATAKKYTQVVMRVWRWASEDDVFGDIVPRPREIRFKTDPVTPVAAPTWEEMDRVIEQATGPHKVLATILRFTGLRVQQAMLLKWSDFDLRASRLTFRGELGKTAAEKQGRLIPISQHLSDYLAGLGRRDNYVVPSNRAEDSPRVREARQRDMIAAWRRAEIREEVWRGRSHHAFRKGFVSELKRSGADTDAVEHLVGHKLPGLRSIYTDPDALPMREAVDMIPPLHEGKVISFDRHRKGAK